MSVAGVSDGNRVTNRMPEPARFASSAAWFRMNRMAAFALAYPPLSGDPPSAAPLDMPMTTLPGASGASSAARVQAKTCRVSVCQLRLKVSHVCSWTGAMCGAAPALRTSRPGRCSRITFSASASPVASAARGVKPSPRSSPTSRRSRSSRAMPTTPVPAATSAAAIARPKPRPAPVTTAVWKRSDIGHSESVVGSVRIKTGRHREIRRRRLSDLHHISTASAVRSRVRVRE